MISKSLRQIKCIKSHVQCVSLLHNKHRSYLIQQSHITNWSLSSVTSFMRSKTKEQKSLTKELKSRPKDLSSEEKERDLALIEDDEDAIITENDNKTGKIRFQRNVPGQPTIYEGEMIGQLQNVKKTKKGMINFHNWEMTRQAVLLCPSTKKGLMPLRKELKFIFPRAVWGVDVHGGFIEVARKLGLKPHRKAPFYIPYLEPNEQYD
eukprot:311636_1